MNKQWKTTESRRCIRNIFSTGDLFIYIFYMFEMIQSTQKKKIQRTSHVQFSRRFSVDSDTVIHRETKRTWWNMPEIVKPARNGEYEKKGTVCAVHNKL